MNKILNTRDIISYAFLGAPLAFAGMPLYVHAPDFYATQYGVSLTAMGIILLFIRLFDAIQDPLIGYLSDRYNSRRLLIVASSSIMLVLSFTALFQKPLTINPLIWFALTMILATTAFSILSINLNTLGGMWSRDRNEKTRIAAYRESFGLAGLLLAVILPAVFIQSIPPGKAFLSVSIILAVTMFIALVIFSAWYKTKRTAINTDQQQKLFFSLSKINKSFYAIYFVSMLASAIPALLVLFFIRDRLQAEANIGLYLTLYFLSGVLGMPIWRYISRKRNKQTAWLTGMVLAVLSFFWAIFLTPETAWQYSIICIMSGIALGADLALPPAILADNIHRDSLESEASSHYGVLTFLSKAALAIASFITLPLLEVAGYKPGVTNDTEAMQGLSLAYAGIPCLIKIIAIFLIWRQKNTGDFNVQDFDRTGSGSPHNGRSNLNV